MLLRLLNESIHYFQSRWKEEQAHRKGCRDAKKLLNREGLKLHLASGVVYKKGWVNIDMDPKFGDLSLDLTRPLPFPDNSCDEAWSEHFLEHLSYPDGGLAFLKEIHRVLKPGGTVTTIVPDTRWPMESYFAGYEADYFKISKEKNWHPKEYTTPIEHVNYHFRQGSEHLFAYDEETLLKILKMAGFSKNRVRDYDPAIDYEHHHPGSLYVVSTKD